MVAEFLSICIPTRNRAHLICDLLASLAREIRRGQLGAEDVKVYVFDNGSEDETGAVVARTTQGLDGFFRYTRHPKNIGAAGNQLLCARTGDGRYRWVIGDDEVLAEGALTWVVDFLRREKPSWMVVGDGQWYGRKLGLPRWFADAREFVRIAKTQDPETLMSAGAWSINIFRADCFDHELAESHAGSSSYPHFFGMMKGLKARGGRVYFSDRPIILFREERPPPPDNEFPPDSDINWRRCLSWLREEYGEEGLDPESQSKSVSKRMMEEALRHPWRAFKYHYKTLLIPRTWGKAAKRAWFFLKR